MTKIKEKRTKETNMKMILDRMVFECDNYLICNESRKNPLNYEIYIKSKKSKWVMNPACVIYSSFDLGLEWSKELAEDYIKKHGTEEFQN